MSPVALLVTMGTPNRHFPSFMPPTAFSAVLASAHSAAEAAAAQGAGSQGSGWSLPTLAVTAGPGDMLVLEQLSGAPMGTAAALASWVQLSMQDVPGVWTRCNHKVGGWRVHSSTARECVGLQGLSMGDVLGMVL